VTTLAQPNMDELVGRVEDLATRVEKLIQCTENDRRARQSWADFSADLTPVAARAVERTIERLDGTVIDSDAVIGLLIRLAEAAPQLERSVGSLVSVTELVGEVGDVGGVVFESMIHRLDDLGRRGYFTFAAGLLEVLDRIVVSFSEEDLRALGDNVVLILETVKQMTQPEIMHLLQRTARIAQEGEEPEKVSLFRLLRELRDPEVKLGLHRAVGLLRGLGSSTDAVAMTEQETR
jgi:uncharacterized protein YjgD (DUF1641 family)